MSHTHAAVKYKPLVKAQVGVGGAGNSLFLAERELEGGQRSQTPRPPRERAPQAGSMEAATSMFSWHLAGTKFCPWDLPVLCLALLRTLGGDFEVEKKCCCALASLQQAHQIW